MKLNLPVRKKAAIILKIWIKSIQKIVSLYHRDAGIPEKYIGHVAHKVNVVVS